jgi:hypothetical protein
MYLTLLYLCGLRLRGEVFMLNWYSQPRYWSSCQPYATGDVVMNMLTKGWHITSVKSIMGENRARLHAVTLQSEKETVDLLVLDGPAIQGVVQQFIL